MSQFANQKNVRAVPDGLGLRIEVSGYFQDFATILPHIKNLYHNFSFGRSDFGIDARIEPRFQLGTGYVDIVIDDFFEETCEECVDKTD